MSLFEKAESDTSKENEYHKVLLAMIAQGFTIFGVNNFLISRLADNVKLYIKDENADARLISGRDEVAEELFTLGLQYLENDSYLCYREIVSVKDNAIKIENVPGPVKMKNNTAVHLYRWNKEFLGSKDGFLITGTMNDNALLETLFIIPAKGVDFEVLTPYPKFYYF